MPQNIQAGRGQHDPGAEAPVPKSLNLFGWSSIMLRRLLASRTRFSFFVLRCILLSKEPREGASAALFPLPMPLDELWSGGLKKLGVARRARLAVRRALFLTVAALNYLHFQNPFFQLKLIQRRPGPHHVQVYDRLIALIKASGPCESIDFLACGRKSHQLVARLEELHGALRSLSLGSSSFYTKEHEGQFVPMVNEKDELRPYRTLDASRLKLTGEANWDCRPYISDLFYMAFVEPRSNQFEVMPPRAVLPDLSRVDALEVIELCKVWDVKGLLKIFPAQLGPQHQWMFSKVFNNFKSQLVDRQIGDRRGANFAEGRIDGGPSKSLPTAASMLQLCPRRYKEALVGSITDRRDFYHQFFYHR